MSRKNEFQTISDPKDPGVLKNYDVLIYYHRSNHNFWRFPVNFPLENEVFQRPCRSVLLPS